MEVVAAIKSKFSCPNKPYFRAMGLGVVLQCLKAIVFNLGLQ